jgi:hypothetical protein
MSRATLGLTRGADNHRIVSNNHHDQGLMPPPLITSNVASPSRFIVSKRTEDNRAQRRKTAAKFAG